MMNRARFHARRFRRRPHVSATLESLERRLLLTDPTLSLSFDRLAPYETYAVYGSKGTVTRTGDLSQSVVVTLVSSDQTEFVMPATVTIAAGQASAMFTGQCVDDTLLDGDQLVTIKASATLTPVGGGETPASATFDLTVKDYEIIEPEISILGRELTYGETTTVILTRTNTDNEDAITVELSTREPTELIIPASVVIPAGQASTTIQMTMVDNGVPEGNRTVSLYITPDDRYLSVGISIDLVEPGTRSITVAADAEAYNSDLDPQFESLNTTSDTIALDSRHRGIFEFDVASIAGRTVQAATLTLQPNIGVSGTLIHRFDVYAYTGDGVASLADALQTGLRVGGFSIDPTRMNGLERQAILLDTGAMQAFVNAGGFVGFVVVMTSGDDLHVRSKETVSWLDDYNRPQLHFFLENNAPSFTNDAYSISIQENSPSNSSAGTYPAIDPDSGDSITYSIVGGSGAAAFSINSTTGALRVSNPSLLDYETTQQFIVLIRATDNGRGTLYDDATVTINLIDVIAPQVVKVEFGYGTDRWIDAALLAGRTAPWQITKVRFTFNQFVSVDVNDLKISNAAGASLAFSAFGFSTANRTATWTLASPLDADRLTITLDGDATNNENQNPDRNFGVSTSGEYLAGGDYLMSLDVLFGDVNGDGTVNIVDALLQRGRNGTDDPWADINGDGIVNIVDVLLLRGRNGTSLS